MQLLLMDYNPKSTNPILNTRNTNPLFKSPEQVRYELNGFLRLDPVLKAKWVTALRSGDFIQATKFLRVENKYCCLGVLCEITGKNWSDFYDGKLLSACRALPTELVQEFFDPSGIITLFNGGGPCVIYKGHVQQVAALNDQGVNFIQIADLIDDQL